MDEVFWKIVQGGGDYIPDSPEYIKPGTHCKGGQDTMTCWWILFDTPWMGPAKHRYYFQKIVLFNTGKIPWEMRGGYYDR